MRLLAHSVFTCLLVLVVAHQGRAQFREEVATLESVYESRARAVLNTMLRPNDYSIVVGAEINQDEQKLQAYREDLELQFIPGLPLPADPDLFPATNKLHDLKTRIAIHLVLSDEISPDRENVIKNVLKVKLHLDEAAGDTLTVERSILPSAHTEPKPRLLPEFSWKTWALIIILALLALAAVIFWANRRQNKALAQAIEDTRPAPVPAEDTSSAEEHPDADDDTSSPEEDIVELRDHILALATQYPQISTNAILEHFNTGHEDAVIQLFEHLGWDVARRMFPNVPPRIWGKIGNMVRNRATPPAAKDYQRSLSECYRVMLSRFLEAGAEKDESNPFAFVFRLGPVERQRLLSGESANNLAILGLYCSPEEMSEVFEMLTPAAQSELTVAIARLETLPESAVRATTQSLLKKLAAIQDKPQVSANGAQVAARLLRSLEPEREMEMFESLLSANPAEAEKIRRIQAQFVDIPYYPVEIVTQATSDLGADLLTAALKGANQTVIDHVLKTLPPKKAAMVERDLGDGVVVPTKKQTAQARRDIAVAIESAFASRALTLDEFWNEKLKSGGDADATSSDRRSVA